jgi:hypothetical protein
MTVLATAAGCGPAALQSRALFPARFGDAWGYITKEGTVAIQPQYQFAARFSEGFAHVILPSGRDAFVDGSGRTVFELDWDFGGHFAGGRALVHTSPPRAQWSFVDRLGRRIAPGFSYAKDFSEGLALVGVGEWPSTKFGYIDSSGRMVIPPRFSGAGSFSQGLAPASEGGLWGYIDRSGRFVLPPKYEDCEPFSEGLAGVKINGRWGFINREGQIVIEATWDGVDSFSEGLATVRQNDLMGVIDKRGAVIIPPTYDFVGPLKSSRAAVHFGPNYAHSRFRSPDLHPWPCWGYVDAQGKLAFEKTFERRAEPFNNGLAQVEDAGGMSYINLKGQTVWREPKAE